MLNLQEITTRVINEVGTECLRRANAMKPDEVNNGSIEFFEGGFVISYQSEISAFLEFGTGTSQTVKDGVSAQSYLRDKPQEIKDEAMKFFKNGKGSIGAQPYLYPAILWALDEVPKRIEAECVAVWSKLKF